MDVRIAMDKPYQFPCDKLKPCPVHVEGAPGPVVIAMCGAFNPLHRAHLALFNAGRAALEAAGRRVLGGYISPVADAYGKPGLIDAWKRVAVAEAIIEGHSDLMIDTWEARQPAYTRTVRVLEHLQDNLNEYYHSNRVSVVWVCGEDLYNSFLIPGVWLLDLLKQMLDTFKLVIIAREDVPGAVPHSAGTVVSGSTSDGQEATLDLANYHFMRTTLATPDNTCSSEVRAVVEASPDERTAVERIVPLVLDHKAAALICRYYGHFHQDPLP